MDTLALPTLPERPADSHKGTWGRVLVIAGSARYPGAAILAARGAGRAGAGLVELAVPEGVGPMVLPAVPFAILRQAPREAAGGFDAAAVDGLLEAAGQADAVVLGPGLGDSEPTGLLVQALLEGIAAPLVLDADGLNHLARLGVQGLDARPGPTVLTPHPGEFARLEASGEPVPPPVPSQVPSQLPSADQRVERAARLASRLGSVVVLKGHRTVVTDGSALYVESAGNPGMATGGMGDVLSGFMGALLAVLPEPAGAAALAVHLHALAGDLAAAELGEEAVLPTDVADRFGRAVRSMRDAGGGGGRARP